MPSLHLPITDPTWIFFIVLSIILVAPMVFERLRIPSIVGLIVAGVALGPHGTHVLNRDASFELFGKVGLYYIMFLASLEMNLGEVMRNRSSALGFGLLSFLLPFGLGLAVNLAVLHLSWPAATLVACMYSAHTLLTYPLVSRWGLGKQRAVGLTVGGTIVTDVITLLILAVIGGMYKPGEHFNLLALVARVVVVSVGIVAIFPWLCRAVFRRVGDSVVQYLFVLVLVFLGAGLMEWVGMEGILGAFLVGLVLNREIPPAGPLMHHIHFVGNAIFIPYFLIGVGMLINIQAMMADYGVFGVATVLLLTGVATKWLSAWLTQRIFSLSGAERSLIFGLSTARAAATLAVALVGYEILLPNGQTLISETLLNASMFLILGSCLVASTVTERAAQALVLSGEAKPVSTQLAKDSLLVALHNPQMVIPMTNMALMLRTPTATAQLTAVSIVLDDNPELRAEAQERLDYAARMAAAVHVRMQTQLRRSVNPVTGTLHTATEHEASDILVGLHQKAHITESFYGKFTSDLLSTAPQQVLIYRPMIPLFTVRRLHIVVPRQGEYDPGFAHWLHRMITLAEQISARLSFYGGRDTLHAIQQFWQEKKCSLSAEHHDYSSWNDFLPLASLLRTDHMVVFILARKGLPSYQRYMERIPEQLERYFSTRSSLIVLPAQAQ